MNPFSFKKEDSFDCNVNSQIQIFTHSEFTQLRVIVRSKDDVWFNLSDIGWGLGYKKFNDKGKMFLFKDRIINIVKKLDIPVVYALYTNSEQPSVLKFEHIKELTTDLDFEQLYIPESGLYELILESKAEGARKFRKWVVEDVLPTIRKTGGYVADENLFIETYLPFADDNTKILFKLTLETIRQQNEMIKQQQQEIVRMKPKEEYYDALVERNHLTNFRDTAKELRIPERKLIQFLIDRGILYRDKKNNLRPYSEYMQYFELKDWVNNGITGVQTLVRPEGKKFIKDLWEMDNFSVYEF